MATTTKEQQQQPSPSNGDDGAKSGPTNALAVAFSNPRAATPSTVVRLDSLPYVDPVNEDYEQYAASLVEDEMEQRVATTTTSTTLAVPPLNTRQSSCLSQAYDRLIASSDKTQQSVDFVHVLSQPSTDSLAEWRAAVRVARTAYEQQRLQSTMLELEKEGITAKQWKLYTQQLEQLQAVWQTAVQRQRNVVEETNFQRQTLHQELGKEIRVLESKYHTIVDQVYHLQNALRNTEHEVAALEETAKS